MLIDGKLVAEASGGSLAGGKGEIDLDAGPHRLEYWHAARGAEAAMEASWTLPGLNKPAPMASFVFGHDKIAHLTAEQLEHRTERYLPDGAAAERLLRERELRRLRIELDRWQNASPEEKAEGRWSLAMMGYWIAQEKYPQAIAVGSDLLAVNAHSLYAQRILYLVDQKPQAAAALQTLLKAHPGGAFAATAEAQVARLQEGKTLDYRSLTPSEAAPRAIEPKP